MRGGGGVIIVVIIIIYATVYFKLKWLKYILEWQIIVYIAWIIANCLHKTCQTYTQRSYLCYICKSIKKVNKQTSLFAENFSQAVTQSSIASVRISSFMSEYWNLKTRETSRFHTGMKAFKFQNQHATGSSRLNLHESGGNCEAFCNHIHRFPVLHLLLDFLPWY